MPLSNEPHRYEPSDAAFAADAVAVGISATEVAEILRIGAEIMIAERANLIPAASTAEHTRPPCVAVDTPDACHATYSSARDELRISMTPMFSARISDADAPPISIELSEREIAELLTISSTQHPLLDTPNLATLITAALSPLPQDRAQHINSALDAHSTSSIEYSPARDELRIHLSPLHKLLVMAHLHASGNLSASSISHAVDLDQRATDSYVAALVDDGVLSEATKYELRGT